MRRTVMVWAAMATASLLLLHPLRATGQDPAGLEGMLFWFLGGTASGPEPNPGPGWENGPDGTTGFDPGVQKEDIIPIEGDSHPPVDEVMDARNDFQPVFRNVPFVSLVAFHPTNRADGFVVGPAAAATLTRPFTVFAARPGGEMEMRVYSATGLSKADISALDRVEFTVSPVSGAGRRALEKYVQSIARPGSGVHVTRTVARAYCVESPKLPPSVDMVYVAGDRAQQAQFLPVQRVRRISEFAASHGFLRPEGDPVAYGRFITQYAIWTRLEHWDQARFTDEFLARAKQAAVAAHQPFTDDTARTLRAVAPHRWHDVQFVIQGADEVDQRMRASAGGAR